jgi:hypothetical protein
MLILTSALIQTGETNLVAHVFTCKQMSGTNPEMEQQMEQERLAILEYPVVRSISDVNLDCSKGGRSGTLGTVLVRPQKLKSPQILPTATRGQHQAKSLVLSKLLSIFEQYLTPRSGCRCICT